MQSEILISRREMTLVSLDSDAFVVCHLSFLEISVRKVQQIATSLSDWRVPLLFAAVLCLTDMASILVPDNRMVQHECR